jgi:hypothetical protein
MYDKQVIQDSEFASTSNSERSRFVEKVQAMFGCAPFPRIERDNQSATTY